MHSLLDEFFQESFKLREVHTSPLLFVSKNDIPDLFSPKKLEVGFQSFKKGKSPRLDEIGTEFLHNWDGVSLGRLALLYYESLALGYVPERWRGPKLFSFPREPLMAELLDQGRSEHLMISDVVLNSHRSAMSALSGASSSGVIPFPWSFPSYQYNNNNSILELLESFRV